MPNMRCYFTVILYSITGFAMRLLLCLLLLIALGCYPNECIAQVQPFPELLMNRLIDPVYMDSLTQLAKRQYHLLTVLPKSPHRDTLRFKTLYYMGRLYMWRNGYRDSTFFYGRELVRQARVSRNNLYEVAGKVLLESYYHADQSKIQEAIRLNHEIYASLPELALLLLIRYRTQINLSDLYSNLNDYISAHRCLTNAKGMASILFEGVKKDALEETIFPDDDSYLKRQTLNSFLIDIDQRLGVVEAKMSNRVESEKQFLEAEILLKKDTSATMKCFIYNAISDFYFTHQHYQQALDYSKKAATIKARNQPQPEAYQWGLLACKYANLGQYALAGQYAQKVLYLSDQPKIGHKETYMALYQIAQHRHD
jgi:hypothetical protein